jgi:hypothetical protein
VRDFLDSVQTADVVKSIDGRTQAAMQTKDLVFNERGQGEVVKEIGKVFPDIRVAILAQTLVVESIDLSVCWRLN